MARLIKLLSGQRKKQGNWNLAPIWTKIKIVTQAPGLRANPHILPCFVVFHLLQEILKKKRIFTYLTSPYCIILSSDVSRRYYAHSSLGCPYILPFIFIPGYLVPLDNAHTAPKRYYRWKWWCGLVSTRITLIASPVTSASTDSASATSFSFTFRWYFARLITMTSQAFSTSTTWLTMCDFRWFLPWS